MFAVCCVVFVMSSCSCCWFSLNCVLVVEFGLLFFALFVYVMCQCVLNVSFVVGRIWRTRWFGYWCFLLGCWFVCWPFVV